MTYKEATEFIEQSNQYGSVLELSTITELLRRLNKPQDRLKIIHIAGTNGKGSTATFLSSILCTAGYKVGRYVSPAVFSYREIIQISECHYKYSSADDISNNYPYNNHKMNNFSEREIKGVENFYIQTSNITKKGIQDIISRIKPICEDMVNDGLYHPTSFEIETAMTFLYMMQKQVDILILETGMGGRLDATNVISHPVCSVITSVSFDHMEFLGNTLEQIAMEKAGIMKPNSFVITCNQRPEVLSVFQKKANELNIPMIVADDAKAYNIRYGKSHTEFVYPAKNIPVFYKIRMLGKHQVQNAILAIETARRMNEYGYNIKEEAIKKGIWQAKWSGRFEKVSNSPDIFIDGAHNEKAALSLRESIEIYFTNRRLIFMIGVLADKDYQSMLRILAPLADTIITLTPNNPRALPSGRLAKEARAYCNRVFDGVEIQQALELAYKEAGYDDVILAFGSLSFLGCLADALGTGWDKD